MALRLYKAPDMKRKEVKLILEVVDRMESLESPNER